MEVAGGELKVQTEFGECEGRKEGAVLCFFFLPAPPVSSIVKIGV